MKLTENHIKELYKFTRKHFVEHYDVQSELVDHLANDIEDIWKENSKISFDEARDKSFKKFGIFGFMDVVEAKQKQMNKRYWTILKRFVKEWFEVPKIILTASIFIGFYLLLSIPNSNYIIMATILILVVYDIIKSLIYRKRIKNKKRKKEKIFLLESMIGETRNSFSFITFINLSHIINLTDLNFNNLSIYWLLAIAFFATLFTITSYVTSVIIPEKAEELLQETYPEYKIVNNL
jgi:hypothetical protein